MDSSSYDLVGTYKIFLHDFQEWSFSNNIMVAASGIAIGLATKDVIQNLLEEIVRPAFLILFQLGIFKTLYKHAIGVVPEGRLDGFLASFGKISWTVFEWIIIIVMTFILLEYFLNRHIIGLKSTVKADEKPDFMKAKAEAHDNIIATHREVKELDKKEKLEKKAGQEIKKQEDKKLEYTAAGKTVPATKETYAQKDSDLPGAPFGDSVFHHIFE